MKRRIIGFGLALSVLLGGCSWMDSSYISVTPHHEQLSGPQTDSLSASEYSELRNILVELTEAGTESAVINVSAYDQSELRQGMEDAVRYITQILPVGVYAIDTVDYELGTSGGQPAISVNISYLHGRLELRKIRQAADMDAVVEMVQEALEACDDSVVIYVENYADVDMVQLVEDHAVQNPNVIMEIPAVAMGVYPDQGLRRVVELKFTYQTSRESLRNMQTQVRRVFASAALYINQDDEEAQKFSQLYTFLTERFDYKIETSITPSYSLLSHGVGDGKTFAMVYAAMCRSADLDCRVVSGTRNGEAWYWNLIRQDGIYYHVDLLESRTAGAFTLLTEEEMEGYVWDYSAHPTSDIQETVPTVTE